MTEAEVRALRDRVFMHRISDSSWDAVRRHWIQPEEVRWLQEHDRPLDWRLTESRTGAIFGTMKRLASLAIAAALYLGPPLAVGIVVGCNGGCTTSQKAVAYKSLNIVATSVDAAMRAYSDAVVAGKVPQSAQAKVRDLHGRYSKAMQAAIAAARFDTSSPSPENVTALSMEILNVITEVIR